MSLMQAINDHNVVLFQTELEKRRATNELPPAVLTEALHRIITSAAPLEMMSRIIQEGAAPRDKNANDQDAFDAVERLKEQELPADYLMILFDSDSEEDSEEYFYPSRPRHYDHVPQEIEDEVESDLGGLEASFLTPTQQMAYITEKRAREKTARRSKIRDEMQRAQRKKRWDAMSHRKKIESTLQYHELHLQFLAKVAENDVKALSEWLDTNPGIDLDYDGGVHGRALHLAVTLPGTDMLQFLLKRGAKKVDALNHQGYAPLHYAALHNKENAIYLLLEANANVNIVDRQGQTPLIIAAAHSCVKAIVALFSYRARLLLDIQDNKGYTALHHSIAKKETSTSLFLIESGASITLCSKAGTSVLTRAISQELAAVTKRLFKHRDLKTALQNEKKLTSLMLAIRNGYVKLATLLIKILVSLKLTTNLHVQNKANKNFTALSYAVRHNNMPIVMHLCQYLTSMPGDRRLHFI